MEVMEVIEIPIESELSADIKTEAAVRGLTCEEFVTQIIIEALKFLS